jgi:N-acetylmuramoyl-L-alanine amidase
LPVWGEEMLIVNTQVLNVRSGPGVNFPLIGQVKLGREFKVEEEKNGWYRIKLSNGTVGWVIKDYVSLNYIELEIQGRVVNIRSGPGTDYTKVSSLPNGTRIKAVGFEGDWYQVIYPGGKGWVAGWLVTALPKTDVSAEPASSANNEFPALPEKPESPGISWGWEKIPSGVQIKVCGSEPLGFSEKTFEGNPKIMLEFGGPWQSPLGVENINYGGVQKISTAKGEIGTLFQVDLDDSISYQTSLSSDGCHLIIDVMCPKDKLFIEEGKKIVVIDPGHGNISSRGYDTGAIGPGGQHESEIVLKIGQLVEKWLAEKGVQVIMTRTKEAYLTLEERGEMANEAGADAFVSIHANSSVSSSISGTSTYFYAPTGSDWAEQREKRKLLAQSVQDKLLAALGRRNLGVREENFAVLRTAQVPAVLVEIAFISNPVHNGLVYPGSQSFHRYPFNNFAD